MTIFVVSSRTAQLPGWHLQAFWLITHGQQVASLWGGGLEQKSVIKYFIEKCKPCEIYRKMDDVYKETCFSQKKNLYKKAKYKFSSNLILSQKNNQQSESTLSNKEKVPGTTVSKEGHVDRLLRHERQYHCWFPWKKKKGATVNRASNCQFVSQNSSY